jgi:hypothetical protein
MSKTLTGGCLCGAIRYSVNAPLTNVVACHCTHCRKISGAGSSHNAIVATSAMTLTSGTPKRYQDTADSGNVLFRHFCGNCGSSLYSQREKTPEMTVLKVGTLDDASELKLVMNIWTDSALPWMHLDPAIARHPKNRPVANV